MNKKHIQSHVILYTYTHIFTHTHTCTVHTHIHFGIIISVIDALALGRHWRFWGFGLKGGGGWKILGKGGSQMVDHIKMLGVCKF